MTNPVAAWDAAADRNVVVRFVDTLLRGAGQVMFQNNPLAGLLILVGVFVGAVEVGVGAVVGLVVGTITAMLLSADQTALRQGMFGFSPLLTGAAVTTFLHPGALMWVYLILGAAVTSVVTLAFNTLLKQWGIPGSTFPFVLTSWFLMLGAYQFGRLGTGTLTAPALPKAGPAGSLPSGATDVLELLLRGVSQVFLVGSWLGGLVILVGLLVSSRWAALWAVVGTVVASFVAAGFGVASSPLDQGLYAFSAVLTAIALGCTFFRPGVKSAVFALLGTVTTVVVQGALDTALAPLGVPSFTAPFVITMWLFLLPKRKLSPVSHHKPIRSGVVSAPADSD